MNTQKKKQPFGLCNDKALTRSLGDWETWLKKLRYEGKPWFQSNIGGVRAHFADFQDKLGRHFQIEEGVLFPFFQRHVPRTEAAVNLFLSEHREMMALLHTVMGVVRLLEVSPPLSCPGQESVRLSEMGVYLSGFVRHHLAAENAIFKQAWSELRACEKKALKNLVAGKAAGTQGPSSRIRKISGKKTAGKRRWVS